MPLSLSDFKRPPQDNGRGVHAIATVGWTGGAEGLDYWITELQALGVKWLKVLDDNGDSLLLCQKLVAAGIFPVVRILRHDLPPNDAPEPNPGHLNAREEAIVRRLLDAGVLYFETNNEPNLVAEWKSGAIPRNMEEAAKLVALNWLFDARFILEAGGYPALPAISIGNDMDLIAALAALGRADILLEGCWIAVHNYSLNHPLNYPGDAVNQMATALTPAEYEQGALTQWVWWNEDRGRADTLGEVNQTRVHGKNTGQTILQDHSCFREFEYYDARARKYLGRSIPLLSTEGGFLIGRREDPRYPRVTPQAHAEHTVALFEFMQRDAPEYYFACMPWLLLPSAGWQQDAWYGDFWERAFRHGRRNIADIPPFPVPGVSVGAVLPVVYAVKALRSVARYEPKLPPLPYPTWNIPEGLAPASATPPPPPSEESVYLVQHGDTLSAIAKRFGIAVAAIAAANQIAEPNRIFAGQRLVIPPLPTAPPLQVPPLIIPAPMVAPTAAPYPTWNIPEGLAPASATPTPPPRPPPPPRLRRDIDLDPRLNALNVRVLTAPVAPGQVYWKLARAVYEDPDQARGGHHIYYLLHDETGAPVSEQRVFQGWQDGQTDAITDLTGETNIPMWAYYAPDRGEAGAYAAWVDGLPSDRVVGLGLPQKQHVNFRLTWQKSVK